jgi:hypothetical protein
MIEVVKCSDCNKPLMHYKKYGVDDKISKIKCLCPFCGGTSFVITITGPYATGPIGQDENYPATVIETAEKKGDTWIFNVKERK